MATSFPRPYGQRQMAHCDQRVSNKVCARKPTPELEVASFRHFLLTHCFREKKKKKHRAPHLAQVITLLHGIESTGPVSVLEGEDHLDFVFHRAVWTVTRAHTQRQLRQTNKQTNKQANKQTQQKNNNKPKQNKTQPSTNTNTPRHSHAHPYTYIYIYIHLYTHIYSPTHDM